jgi:hypothetical protein
VLIAAFEEVEGFDPRRGHNGPSPALWIDDADYLQDVKSFLGELRRLNDFLSRPVDNAKAEQAASLVARATTKFVESYAGHWGREPPRSPSGLRRRCSTTSAWAKRSSSRSGGS